MAQSVWHRDDLTNILAAAEMGLLQTGVSPEYRAGFLAALATVARSLGVKTTPPRRCEVVETPRRLLTEGVEL